jgi:lipid II isoglutaminyl synthase (glutamine-hydrolysing)
MSSGRMVQWSPAASARRAIAVSIGKAAHSGVRYLGDGNGAAIPGRVALAIDPGSLGSLVAEIRRGSILVTGTAGKGTTCRMLAQVMRTAGLHPVLSADHSDRRSGLASSLVAYADRTGHLRIDPQAIGLFDVDEGSFDEIIRHVPEPAAVVCTNIFRDQIDRYVEPGYVKTLLERSIRKLPGTTTLILNADDPRVADLASDLPNPRLYFGMSDPIYGRVRADPTSDFPRCPRCDGELTYACVYYAHLGHWACASCGLSRPKPDVSVTKIDLVRSASIRLHVATATAKTVVEIPLPGLYNGYNALAAVAAAAQCGLPDWSLGATGHVIAGSLRMERIKVTGHDVYLATARNANGYTEVLRAVLGDGEPKRMLLGLNDCPGRPHDTSWIWDVDFDSLTGLVPAPVIAGDGAADLAVRLKYAGWLGDGQDHGQSAGAIIEPDPVRAFQLAIAATPPGQPLWIVSTSGVLAEIRRWLRRSGYARELWRAQDGHRPAAARVNQQPIAGGGTR